MRRFSTVSNEYDNEKPSDVTGEGVSCSFASFLLSSRSRQVPAEEETASGRGVVAVVGSGSGSGRDGGRLEAWRGKQDEQSNG